MTIQEVSEKTGLSKHTLRYYEKIGLIDTVKKSKSNYRIYNQNDLNRLEFICNMREAGMGISKLKEYIQLTSQGENTVEERRGILLENKKKIQEEIKLLEKSMNYIEYKIENYDSIIKNKKI
ncbi:MerR family transcriptional regulator [Mollicutes bacterium LVI A0078]|nr:MerR family transcriptional regulator [Mollicutes bacterium LVI A0075]WOO90870.1 MerR family transcriptional regulator [Mollicutes bacterium LVI A0078]